MAKKPAKSHDKEFLAELLKLCGKFKVNLEVVRAEFAKGGVYYNFIDVTGQWKCGGAVHAEKVIQHAVVEQIKLDS